MISTPLLEGLETAPALACRPAEFARESRRFVALESTTPCPNPTPKSNPGDGGPSDIRPVSITDELSRSYLDYAMSVIVSRAA